MDTVQFISDYLFKIGGLINTLSGAYATATIALVGWIFGSNREWPWQQKAAITIVYSLGISLICISQIRLSYIATALLSDLKHAVASKPDLSNLTSAVDGVGFLPARVLIIIYLSVGASLIYLVWIQNRICTTTQANKTLDSKT